jgi:hypothetical protein
MNVWFGQIYIEAGVNFPLNHLFQRRLSQEITALAQPSPKFIEEYGSDFNLIFRISAKKKLQDNEIRGPTVFRKGKNVEYTVFLPFDIISHHSDVPQSALKFLLKGVCSVFQSLGIDTSKVIERQETMIENICSDLTMFKAARKA